MGMRRPWGGFTIAAIGAASVVTAGAGVLGADRGREGRPPVPPPKALVGLAEPAPEALVGVAVPAPAALVGVAQPAAPEEPVGVAEPAGPMAEAEVGTGDPVVAEPVASNQPQLFPVPASLE